MRFHVNIDSRGMRYWEAQLRMLGDKKFPNAVRNTLNNLAFEMKGRQGKEGTIEKRSRSEFDYRRNKTFIRSITWAGKVKQTNVEGMESWAGIYKKEGKNKVARRMPKQQTGGSLRRKFIPLKDARIGKSMKGKVSKRNKHANLNDLVDTTGMSKGQKIRAMFGAQKSRSPILVKGRKGVVMASPYKTRIGSRKKGSLRLPKLKFIYKKTDGSVSLNRKRAFVDKAGVDAFRKFDKIWKKEIDKALNTRRR